MNKEISSLINHFYGKGYIDSEDIIYASNQVIGMLGIEEFVYDELSAMDFYDTLESIMKYAVDNQIINDYIYEKEILEARLTNIFIDKPSVIQNNFDINDASNSANYLYQLGVDTNYIKLNDLKKNIRYQTKIDNNYLEISINLAKPEKDAKEIAMLMQTVSKEYPKCALCAENVGFYGSSVKSARSNHRVVNFNLNGKPWFLQFSPYLYYDMHCILIEKEHSNMYVNQDTLKAQLDFVSMFDGYFMGNNAGLPIVGGSILNHNHFQGGVYNFPIDYASSKYEKQMGEVNVSYLDWHLCSLKLESSNREEIEKMAYKIMDNWLLYSNESINVFNNNGSNNSLNFISRYENNVYKVYIILRNNGVNEERPDGIFHPDKKFHNIKKENIGLIEAMGVAILPGRVKEQFDVIRKYLVNDSVKVDDIYIDFANELKANYNGECTEEYVNNHVAYKFKEILLSCNVLKYCDDDISEVRTLFE